jgi:hypothetical protein
VHDEPGRLERPGVAIDRPTPSSMRADAAAYAAASAW